MKRLMYILLIFLSCHSLFAQLVTKEEAISVAVQYRYNKQWNVHNSDADSIINESILVKQFSITGKAILYGVQFNQDGWILVSSNKAVRPVLGTCEHGIIPNIEDMPEGMKWLLSFYEEVIEGVANKSDIIHPDWHTNSNYSIRTGTDVAKITAFDNIKWGQIGNNSSNNNCRRAYNKYCPSSSFYSNCGHTPTGCAAVAIGQVMKYYQWPTYANVPDTAFTTYPITTVEAFYDWNMIPNALYSSSNRNYENAIALFLRDCGYALQTQFGDFSSSTPSSRLLPTLMSYFGYSSSMQKITRTSSNNATFIANVKNELDNQRPVIYWGHSSSNPNDSVSGHVFVVYGYKTDNQFYINWGWCGGYDGSFALDSLTPDYEHNFSYRQSAIINIAPDYCTPQKVNPDESWSQSFTKQYVGNIEIGNRTILANQQGTVTAANSIRLTNGLIIEQGADVLMSIEGTSCGDLPAVANYLMPDIQQEKYQNGVLSLNRKIISKPMDVMRLSVRQMDNILLVECDSKLTQISIYDISGRPVYQVFEHEINISQLPEGLYILQAQTTDGELLQGKFIHSR